MNKDKLESLRRLAADERTPVEEARNAALLFVRGGGRAEIRDESDVVSREDFQRARDQLAVMTRERDAAIERADRADRNGAENTRRMTEDRDKWQDYALRIRSILTRLMDARKAEEIAGKVRAQAEQEARDALGGEEKKPETGETGTSKPAGGWRPSPFGTYVKMF